MKGKIAFVIGAAVGYVLGTRAGRERYEQIKKGAQSIWNTAPVQRGVGAAKGAVQSKVDDLKASIVRASKDAFVGLTREPQPGAAGEANVSADQVPTSQQAVQSSDRAS